MQFSVNAVCSASSLSQHLPHHMAYNFLTSLHGGFIGQVRNSVIIFQLAARRHAFNRRVAARVVARQQREAREAEARAELQRKEQGFEAMKQQYGVTELHEVHAALACYSALKTELNSTNPEHVQQALAVYGALLRDLGAADVAKVKAALSVAAVTEQELGSLDVDQLRQSLVFARSTQQDLAVVGQEVGGTAAVLELARTAQSHGITSSQQLSAALEIHAVAQQAGVSDGQQAATALGMYAAVQRVGLTRPSATAAATATALQAGGYQAGVPSAEEVATAMAMYATATAAGYQQPEDLSAALAVSSAAQQAGCSNSDDISNAVAVYAAAHAAGVTAPADVASAATAYASIPAAHRHANPDSLQRAVSVYNIAADAGMLDQQELRSALSWYGILKQGGIDNAEQLQATLLAAAAAPADGLPSPVAVGNGDAVGLVGSSQHPNGIDNAPNGEAAVGGSLRRINSMKAAATSSSTPEATDLEVIHLRKQLQLEKTARQRYAIKLEEQAVEWMQQVRLLKEYIDTLKARVPPGQGVQLPPMLGATTLDQGGGATATRQGSGSSSFSAHNPVVSQLAGEFMSKAPLFDDDANFIREVAGGQSAAPEMDPEFELERLKKKYRLWNKAFEDRLREAQQTLKRRQMNSQASGIDINSIPDLRAPELLENTSRSQTSSPYEQQQAPYSAPVYQQQQYQQQQQQYQPPQPPAAASSKKKRGLFNKLLG